MTKTTFRTYNKDRKNLRASQATWLPQGPKRAAGTNPRALGTNPRALGTNPRAFAPEGTKPFQQQQKQLMRAAAYVQNRKEVNRQFIQSTEAACFDCDGSGWRLSPAGGVETNTVERCDHDKTKASDELEPCDEDEPP